MTTTNILRDSWRSWVANDFHPAGPRWLQWMWTLLLCAVIAAGFTMLAFVHHARGHGRSLGLDGWTRQYLLNLHMSVVIGLLIHVLFGVAQRLLGENRMAVLENGGRLLYYSGIPLLGVAIGWPLGYVLLGKSIDGWFASERINMLMAGILVALLITFVLYQVFESKARAILTERQAAETQLHLLQAQIEPHFLFNTLANVLSLIESDAPRARRMLEAFTDYLRSSLGELRRGDVSLDEELALARAYLQVQQMRMDDRLRIAIDADDEARAAALPPLLVQPLVENAVLHGIEPRLEGGSLSLRARRDGERLIVEVIDDGIGLHATPRTGRNGIALVNLRERLAARFGRTASLTLEALAAGTHCRLELPYRPLR